MTTVFHPWTNLAFVKIENSSRGQKSLRSKERANHLAGLFGNRQDVGVPPKIRSEFKTKESFKAGCLHKGRITMNTLINNHGGIKDQGGKMFEI